MTPPTVPVGGLLPDVKGFITNIGGIKITSETPIGDTQGGVILYSSGIHVCDEGKTANLPSDAGGRYVLINYIAHPGYYYIIQFLFGLNIQKRYTRLKIDSSWQEWVEF